MWVPYRGGNNLKHHLFVDAFVRYRSTTGAVVDPTAKLLRITPVQYANVKLLFFTIAGTLELTASAQICPRALNELIAGSDRGYWTPSRQRHWFDHRNGVRGYNRLHIPLSVSIQFSIPEGTIWSCHCSVHCGEIQLIIRDG